MVQSSSLMKLNIGCGHDVKQGWVNLDISPIEGVDVVHDLSDLPLPFEDNTFDYILCMDVLEHLEYIPVLKDLHRILKPSGTIKIQVPHFTSRYSFGDPTHRKLFSIMTFEFFVKGNKHLRDYYFDFHFSSIQNQFISFEKGIFIYNYLVEPIINLSFASRRVFEATALSRLFPGANISLELVK